MTEDEAKTMEAMLVGRAKARYVAATHAMQTGVKLTLDRQKSKGDTPTFADTSSFGPKHVRVGINSAMVETSALVWLLIEKGLISELEWFEALAEQMEAEQAAYEQRLGVKLG